MRSVPRGIGFVTVVGSLALGALVSLGCSGGYPQGGGQQQPQQANQQGNAQQGQTAAGQQSGESTEALIGDLLAGIDSSGQQPAASGNETIPPPASSPTTGTTGGGSGNLDTFEEDVKRIRSLVPNWDNGTGLTVRFLKQSTGKRLSLIYVDPTPPLFKDGPGLWMIQAKATANDKVLGWVVVLLKNLAPGNYQGSPSQKDVVLAVCMGETWDGKNPETTWSINPGSWAEITLRAGATAGDLEGNFRGKLVDNKGTGFHTIESGYIYINR
jgi:hypothetical protein